MSDDTNHRAQAIAALTDMFIETALAAFEVSALESDCIDLGHECMACAQGRVLEAFDEALMAARGDGLVVHDRRSRTLATEVGGVSFLIRRYRDRYGCDIYLLADRLDIPYRARVAPGAAGFLTIAASMRSYATAADPLARHGSLVGASAAMSVLRGVGDTYEEVDAEAAASLYENGVVPDAEHVREEVSMKADGTRLSVQRPGPGEPRRFKAKAMCAYAGKDERDGKTHRRDWTDGMATPFWTTSSETQARLSELHRAHVAELGVEPHVVAPLQLYPGPSELAAQALLGLVDPLREDGRGPL